MPLMLLSNPGLHLAVLGNPSAKAAHGFGSRKMFRQAERRAHRRVGKTFMLKGQASGYSVGSIKLNKSGVPKKVVGVPWSGRRGVFRYSGVIKKKGGASKRATWTNPLRVLRNPMSAISNYVGAVKSAVPTTLATLKKPSAKGIGFAAAGLVGTYALGGIIAAKVIVPGLNKVPALASFAGSNIGKRVIGASIPLLIGAGASLVVKGDNGKAILAGSVIAAVMEAAMPGTLVKLLSKLPVIGSKFATASYLPTSMATGAAAQGPVNGLAGLGAIVTVKSISTTSPGVMDGYEQVRADSFATPGKLNGLGEDSLAAYVAASESALNSDTVLAGVDGYLEEAEEGNMVSYLNTYGRNRKAERAELAAAY
jgi:hypothetical protein